MQVRPTFPRAIHLPRLREDSTSLTGIKVELSLLFKIVLPALGSSLLLPSLMVSRGKICDSFEVLCPLQESLSIASTSWTIWYLAHSLRTRLGPRAKDRLGILKDKDLLDWIQLPLYMYIPPCSVLPGKLPDHMLSQPGLLVGNGCCDTSSNVQHEAMGIFNNIHQHRRYAINKNLARADPSIQKAYTSCPQHDICT